MCLCLPGSREDSGEVHHGDHGQVPGAQQTLDGLELFVEEVKDSLGRYNIEFSSSISRTVSSLSPLACVSL